MAHTTLRPVGPHILMSHYEPTEKRHVYDNVTLLLGVIRSIFDLLQQAQEGEAASDVAYLAEQLCDELDRRVRVLYEWDAPPAPERE